MQPIDLYLARLSRWVATHGLDVVLIGGRIRFTDHDGQPHSITTMGAARDALGY